MQTDPRAGQPADPSMWVDIPRLMTAYYTRRPDASMPEQRVAFGTSGHRGSAFDCAFNEDHMLAITQALCEYGRWRRINGPLFLGIDTYALSESAFATALEVLAAHEMEVRIDDREGYTPTRSSPTRSSPITTEDAAPGAWPTESSSHPPTTRRRTEASSTTRPPGVRRTPR
jgi:phosphoglucomutase